MESIMVKDGESSSATKVIKSKLDLLKKSKVNSYVKAGKNDTIVIRNLSFKCTEEKLRNYYSAYGEIRNLAILKKEDGTMKGIAFIQYDSGESAQKAISDCNLKKFYGRIMAVDLYIEKKEYRKLQKVDVKTEIKTEPTDNYEKTGIKIEPGLETEKEFIKTEGDDFDSSVVKEELTEEESVHESDNETMVSEENINSEDRERKYTRKHESGAGATVQSRFVHPARSKDVAEKKTLFVRSIGFSSTEKGVENLFSKFGGVDYVLFCKDKQTQRFKGSGFVKFNDADDIQKCLDAFEDPARRKDFCLDGRYLFVFLASSRGDLKIKASKEEQKTDVRDKRNLYLSKEGYIRENSEAAEGVSKTDMALRQKLRANKKKMLKNLHIFLSPLRLCVHNLPASVGDQQLRDMFKKYAPKGAKITESRVLRNLKILGKNGKPISREYGFVSFKKHEHALMALRKVNNNPEIFSEKKRPIVEFSLENMAALKARQKRLQKSQENNPTHKNYIPPEKRASSNSQFHQNSKNKKDITGGASINKRRESVKKRKISRKQVNNVYRNKFKKRGLNRTNKEVKVSNKKRLKKSASAGPPKKRRKLS